MKKSFFSSIQPFFLKAKKCHLEQQDVSASSLSAVFILSFSGLQAVLSLFKRHLL